jgi:hypothetical protein
MNGASTSSSGAHWAARVAVLPAALCLRGRTGDPEKAFAHIAAGWRPLQRGDGPEAMERFREALRIEPDLDTAGPGRPGGRVRP